MTQHIIVGKLLIMMICPRAMAQADSGKYEIPPA